MRSVKLEFDHVSGRVDSNLTTMKTSANSLDDSKSSGMEKIDDKTPQENVESDELEKKPDVFEIPKRFTKNGNRKAVSFPLKLMHILSHSEYEDIISWLPDGHAFEIIDREALTSFVLPKYFKEAKYSSFTRKLLRWGFQNHKTHYTHEFFRKDRLDMLYKMTCQSYKKNDPVPHYPTSRPFYPQHNTLMLAPNGRPSLVPQPNPFALPMGYGRQLALPRSHFSHPIAGTANALQAIEDELLAVRNLLKKKKIESASLPARNLGLSVNPQPGVTTSTGSVGIPMNAQVSLSALSPGNDIANMELTPNIAPWPLSNTVAQQVAGMPPSSKSGAGPVGPPADYFHRMPIEMEIRRRLKERVDAHSMGNRQNVYM